MTKSGNYKYQELHREHVKPIVNYWRPQLADAVMWLNELGITIYEISKRLDLSDTFINELKSEAKNNQK